MTQLFGDRLAAAIEATGSICVGLDPRLESIPAIVTAKADRQETAEARVRAAIGGFHRIVIDAVADLVPIVKLQLAFYEQYGIGGLLAYQDTVTAARAAGLLVIADAKRKRRAVDGRGLRPCVPAPNRERCATGLRGRRRDRQPLPRA